MGCAELQLDRGDADAAADLLDRLLRDVPEGSRTQRALALDVVVRARVAQGDEHGARAALAELRDVAEVVGGDALPNIFAKLGCASRSAAMAEALRRGLL